MLVNTDLVLNSPQCLKQVEFKETGIQNLFPFFVSRRHMLLVEGVCSVHYQPSCNLAIYFTFSLFAYKHNIL
jgi:hypothetical protein